MRKLRLLVALVAVVGLAAACGSDDDGGDDASSDDSATADDGPVREFVMYGSAGAIEEAMVNELLPEFERQYNARVTYVGMGSSEALSRSLAQRSNPEASLVIGNDVAGAVGAAEGIWAPLDGDVLPILDELPDDALRDDGHSVTTGILAMGIAYNPDIYEENGIAPPETWDDLFAEEAAGHIAQYDVTFGLTAPFLHALNIQLGGDYDDFEPVLDLFREHRDKIASFPTQAAEWDQAYQQGATWVGVNASSRGGIVRSTGVPLEMVYPDEGVAVVRAQAMIPANADEPDAAMDLLNFLLTPDAQEIYAATQFYVPIHPDATLEPDVAAALPRLDDLNIIELDWLEMQSVNDAFTDEWTRTVVQG